jgi:hypothetical protein
MTKKVAIPLELKYNYMKGMVTTLFKAVMYEYREKHGASAALEFFEGVWKRDDRVKNLTTTLKEVFKIEGKDIEAIQKWFDIFWELMGIDGTTIELTKALLRNRIPMGCEWKTKPKDISDWILIFFDIVVKTINPKMTVERPKGMCAGDSYCEYVYKLEE